MYIYIYIDESKLSVDILHLIQYKHVVSKDRDIDTLYIFAD